MRLIKTELNENFVKMDNEQIVLVISECYGMIKALLKVDSVLISKEEAVKSKLGLDDFEYGQLDTLDVLVEVPFPKNLDLFALGLCSDSLVCNRRAKNSVEYFKVCQEMAGKYAEAYVPLTSEEITKLKANIKECLGHLAYFLFFQFRLGDTLANFIKGEEIEIDFNFNKFCNGKGLDFRNVIAELKAVAWSYRPKLPVFEEFPDLEEEFYDIAGAYVHDFDVLEDNLTLDVVKQVLSGDCDIEALIRSVEKRE